MKPKHVNEKVKVKIEGKEKEYIIVGIAENIDFDSLKLNESKFGAITYLTEDMIKNEMKVNATILTFNIQKIYKTANNLANKFNMQEKVVESKKLNLEEKELLEKEILSEEYQKENKEDGLKFNIELLGYECVIDAKTDFEIKFITARNIKYSY